MKKPQSIFIAVILIIAVIVGIVAVKFSPTEFSFLSGGFIVNSITASPSIISNSNLANAKFIVDTALSSHGQSIVGTITPQQFQTESTYSTTYPLEIGVTSVQETAHYKLTSQQQQIYYYDWARFDCPKTIFGICTGSAQVCPADYPHEAGSISNLFGVVFNRWCVLQYSKGGTGIVERPSTSFSANVYVTSNGQKIQQTISSKSDITVNFIEPSTSKWRASATWYGSLVTGDNPPYEGNYGAIFLKSRNSWQLTQKTTLDNYITQSISTQNKYNSVPRTAFNPAQGETDVQAGDRIMKEIYQPNNDQVNQLINSPQTINGNTPTGTETIAKVDVPLSVSVTVPKILWYVDASWLGIKIPVSKPQIISTSCGDFYAGAQGNKIGNIQANVKNVGQTQGSFAVKVEGCSPLRMLDNVQTQTVQAGMTSEYNVRIDAGSANEELTKTCSVTAYDVNDPANSATYSATCTVHRAQECVPNTFKQSGSCIMQCKPDGSDYALVKCCEFVTTINGKLDCETSNCQQDTDCQTGYICQSGACVQSPSSYTIACTADNQCKDTEQCLGGKCVQKQTCKLSIWQPFFGIGSYLNCVLTPLKWALIGIVLVILPLILLYFTNKFRLFPKKNWYFGWILGLFVAGFIGIIIWFYLITGLILAVILSIIILIISPMIKRRR